MSIKRYEHFFIFSSYLTQNPCKSDEKKEKANFLRQDFVKLIQTISLKNSTFAISNETQSHFNQKLLIKLLNLLFQGQNNIEAKFFQGQNNIEAKFGKFFIILKHCLP